MSKNSRRKKKEIAKPSSNGSSPERRKQNSKWHKWGLSDSISIIIAVTALVVSIKSCNISENALKSSNKSFIFENRPFVKLEAVRFSDGSFMNISSEGKEVVIKLAYSMQNVGKQPAKNISMPKAYGMPYPLTEDNPIDFYLPPLQTLAPGQSLIVNPKYVFRPDTKSIDAEIESIYRNGFYCQIYIEYFSDIEPNKKYTTRIENKFLRHEAVLLKSDMMEIDLPEK